jgi:hypothetical protein
MDYEQDDDPEDVGAGKKWYDTDTDKYYIRNGNNTG